MDPQATMIYTIIKAEDTPTFQPNAFWSLSNNDKPVVCDFQQTVRRATNGKRLLDYWQRSGKTGTLHPEIVAWDSYHQAMKQIPRNKRRRVIKHTSERCAVGKEMLRRKECPHSKCPRCDEPI